MIVISNQVKVAVERVGGPTKASNILGVANSTIHNWMKAGRVSNIEFARQLSALSNISLQEIRPTR